MLLPCGRAGNPWNFQFSNANSRGIVSIGALCVVQKSSQISRPDIFRGLLLLLVLQGVNILLYVVLLCRYFQA